ncbi:unnamed protein product [Closterium sp. Yama58-4]|nr:unnamed protein product [Closterium sp. Yama58-4]
MAPLTTTTAVAHQLIPVLPSPQSWFWGWKPILSSPPSRRAPVPRSRFEQCVVVLLLLLVTLVLHVARFPLKRSQSDKAEQGTPSHCINADGAATAAAFSRGLDALASWEEEAALRDGGNWWTDPQEQPARSLQRADDSRIIRVAAVTVDGAVKFHHKQGRTAQYRVVPFSPPPAAEGNATWDDFYPDVGIYEPFNSSCPAVPRASWEEDGFNDDVADAVVAVVPCRPEPNSMARDVRWLQVLLSIARFASKSQRPWMPIVIVSPCRPPLNLFHCNFLARPEPAAQAAAHGIVGAGPQGDVWVYNVTATDMRERIQPPGSCAMAQPTGGAATAVAHSPSTAPPRFAFVTVLHSKDDYVCGAIVLAHALRTTGLALPPALIAGYTSANASGGGAAQPAEAELVAMVSAELSADSRRGLEAAGWRIVEIERVRSPWAKPGQHSEYNFSNLRLWGLVEYKRIVYIDSDFLPFHSLTHLFLYPELSAGGNDDHRFNGGMMVIEPSLCTQAFLIANIRYLVSYNRGFQGFINNAYPWWHRLPDFTNLLKHKPLHGHAYPDGGLAAQNALFASDPPQMTTIHYLGRKPWVCFRDFDCNLSASLHDLKFVNDVAFRRWWAVHDGIDESLKQWCWLSEELKQVLWRGMKKRKQDGVEPERWNYTITDPRKDLVLPWKVNQRTWPGWLRKLSPSRVAATA